MFSFTQNIQEAKSYTMIAMSYEIAHQNPPSKEIAERVLFVVRYVVLCSVVGQKWEGLKSTTATCTPSYVRKTTHLHVVLLHSPRICLSETTGGSHRLQHRQTLFLQTARCGYAEYTAFADQFRRRSSSRHRSLRTARTTHLLSYDCCSSCHRRT